MAEVSTINADLSLKRDSVPFNVLNDKEFELVKRTHTVEFFNAGELIYNESDKADGIRLLICGKVKIFKRGINGKEQIVKMASANDFVGYRAVFAEELHTTSAMTLEPSKLFFIPSDTIFKLFNSNSQLATFIVKSIAVELSFSRYRSVSLSQKQIRGRLAESLLVLRDKYGYIKGNQLNISLSREDLANLSNMTASNAVRTLAAFVSEKIIDVHSREIYILNEPALERISRMG
ncbi:MAG: Crp/Fnr family transcriptional regulator [Bacteroidales bacterium]|nr:Crp/Fnr family transcriptional regulator [Bacteroidales bacterium]